MLYISVRTAETHRAHIMRKLRLETRAELVRYALAQGLLNEPERLGSQPGPLSEGAEREVGMLGEVRGEIASRDLAGRPPERRFRGGRGVHVAAARALCGGIPAASPSEGDRAEPGRRAWARPRRRLSLRSTRLPRPPAGRPGHLV